MRTRLYIFTDSLKIVIKKVTAKGFNKKSVEDCRSIEKLVNDRGFEEAVEYLKEVYKPIDVLFLTSK